jgi:23S rRNA (adenine2503-C2)-methyltransferase
VYLTPPDKLAELLPEEPPFRVRQLRAWLYRTPVLRAADMTNLPTQLRDRIELSLWPFAVDQQQIGDNGRTVKWLLRTGDDAAIESVLIGYPSRTTLCISSQAGCAMACSFCATGQFGFERHLDAGEITAQVAYAAAWLRGPGMPGCPDRLSNVVFMGMGEPLANYKPVREAIRRLIVEMGISARSITVSTVGVVPGMLRLAEEPWPLTLALSLHAADDDLRSRLVPLNRRYPIDDLIAAATAYRQRKGRRVSLEWALIAGVNDTPEQARGLAAIAGELRAHVNVIPLNTTPLCTLRPPSQAAARAFVAQVRSAGANATLRRTRGRDIDAACGQLRTRRAGDTAGGTAGHGTAQSRR